MPGLNAIDVFDLSGGHCAVARSWVLFVRTAGDRAREAFAHCGIRDVMSKPFAAEALTGRVHDSLARATATA